MTTARDNVFSGRMAFCLLVIGTAALAGSILLGIFGNQGAPQNVAGSNAYSDSAVGHAAFVALLQAQGIPTDITRLPPAGRLSSSTVVVLAQPDPDTIDATTLRAVLDGDTRVLVVLPKWETWPSADHPGWIEQAELIPQGRLDRFAEMIAGNMSVVRPAIVGPWRGRLAGDGPILDTPQLVRSAHLLPLIETDGGVLLGLLRNTGGRVAVLADPDLLTNAGLHRGGNAAIVMAMIEDIRPGEGAVVVDETIHGFVHAKSIWRFLLTPPWLGATVLALLAAALTVWIAAVRFGAPVPAPPPQQAGKTSLVANGASLLVHGGHLRAIVGRYCAATVAEVAERLRIGAGNDEEEQRALLDQAARRRGLRLRLAEKGNETPLAAARHVHAWKREMLGGP